MAAPLRRLLGTRFSIAGRISPVFPSDCSGTPLRSVSCCGGDVEFSDDIVSGSRSGFRVLEESGVSSFRVSECGGLMPDLGRRFQSGGSALAASRTGGLMSRNGVLQEGLGFCDRGYASKAKKSGGKARTF